MQFCNLLGGGERVLLSDALSCSIVAKLYGCRTTIMVLFKSKAPVRKGALSTDLGMHMLHINIVAMVVYLSFTLCRLC
jgi:hypothetical protein